ncbi:MAG TPA: tetratricopeptide repeat protein [Anaerolineales bacterium]|nr:tetratricopeptide repeat protein [Anaerolineales bacterium]HLO32342.1 tetratricopeptide repeat protein [Anaerolineales bacterium]
MLIQQDKCVEAMPILNALIEEKPDWNLPYESRYSCNISFQSNVFTVQQGYLLAALQDLNTLVQLDPTSGGYRAWREYALRQIAALEQYSANQFAIYDLANQDAVKAIELGVVPSSYVYRHHARNLIEGNHCQEGLAEIQKLIDKATMQSEEFGQYYSLYETEAYICLGKLDKALSSAQYITCDDPATACKTGLLALIYFQSGDYKKALDTLNNMINLQPAGGGWRYFIRGLIEYENGEKDIALQDLEFGAANIWHEGGVYWYVKAKLAMDAGDKENGISYLQTAEQTLDVTYTPFRQQIIDELKIYGAEPITREPNLPFAPLPTP